MSHSNLMTEDFYVPIITEQEKLAEKVREVPLSTRDEGRDEAASNKPELWNSEWPSWLETFFNEPSEPNDKI